MGSAIVTPPGLAFPVFWSLSTVPAALSMAHQEHQLLARQVPFDLREEVHEFRRRNAAGKRSTEKGGEDGSACE